MSATTEVASPAEGHPNRRVPTVRWAGIPLPPGWPLMAALVFFPFWWAIGIGGLIFPVFAIPMAIELRRRPYVTVPPFFWLWAFFVFWSLLGFVMLGVQAPGTLPETLVGSLDAFVLRSLQYLAATVVLLYVCNLPELEVPRQKIVRWLGVLFIWALAGGFLGLALPGLQWKSPVELLLPGPLASRRGLISMVHPQVAQIQDVIGTGDPRPNAPFEYTNAWGNNISILLIWFIVGYVFFAVGKRRWLGVATVGIAVVPIIYSLNRGVWIGLVLSLIFVIVRLSIAGKPWLLGGLVVAGVFGFLLMSFTPLGGVVQGRAENGNSDQVRQTLAQAAIDGGRASPILGYGGTRDTIGSDESIAIGATDNCPRCGNRTVGSTGQAWNVLFSQGFVGLFAFVGFFVATLFRYRKDVTAIGIAGQTIILVQLFYMYAYVGISSTLSLVMITVGLLWRNDVARREGYPDPPIPGLFESTFHKLPPRWPAPRPEIPAS